MMTIGKLAQKAGVRVDTIRFYEKIGLIETPMRTQSGYRMYSESDVRRIRFIRKAKELGFTLREIKELLELKMAPGTTCAHIRRRAQVKIEDIEVKIEALQKLKRALEKLIETCHGIGPVSDCPILDMLEREDVS